jgi:formylglycine-generating enzyme required for sulfatase activity
MNRKFSLLCLFLTSALVLGFSSLNTSIIRAKDIESRLARFSDSLYIGKYEVTNKEYNEFINFLIASNQKELADLYKIDSGKWMNHPDGIAYSKYYHSHASYADYPVVGISYDGARAYCNWLGKQYSGDNKRKFKKVIFRLPTSHEWMEAAYAGKYKNRYPWGNYLIRSSGEFMAMYRKISDQRITYDTVDKVYRVIISSEEINSWDGHPAPVDTFWPNSLGIRHQSGNVAEMVAEKGLAKGGSFNDPGFDIQISSAKHYNEPSNELGFRIAMQIVN